MRNVTTHLVDSSASVMMDTTVQETFVMVSNTEIILRAIHKFSQLIDIINSGIFLLKKIVTKLSFAYISIVKNCLNLVRLLYVADQVILL